ncbi:hypothetical protein C8P63_1373 [Melghirimyces profundicolus]|uniref:Uncharacterized protein n=1 Tax=Melghirimyces profundicolus TaxID=1242148 RepID=A0A2T6B2M1_9BACL|nr:hypothetical protein C8P63_1373 [Melghirimyces profundicolus]
MVSLGQLERDLSKLFRLDAFDPDPAFSRFLPAVYEETDLDWRRELEPVFTETFNGWMIRGEAEVGRVFLAVFPADGVGKRDPDETLAGGSLWNGIRLGSPREVVGMKNKEPSTRGWKVLYSSLLFSSFRIRFSSGVTKRVFCSS